MAEPTATNGFDRFARNGPSVDVQYLRYVADWIAFGGELSFAKFGKGTAMLDTTALLGTPSSTALAVQTQTLAFNLLGRFNLRKDGASWTPYLLGGAGYGFVNTKWGLPNASPAAQAGLSKTSGKTSGFDVLGAAGAEAFVASGISLSFEARFTEYRHTGLAVNNVAVFPASIESLTYFLGIRFWFAPK